MFSHLSRVFRAQLLTKTRLLTRSTHGLVKAESFDPATRLLVEKVEKEDANGMLHVTWTNNSVNRYPFVYLRDNCRCSECFHQSSLQRSYDTVGHLDVNIVADQVQVLQDGEQFSITWPDKHVSVFDSEWLHSRRLMEDEESRNKPSRLSREDVELWNAEKIQNGRGIPRYNFQELMEDDMTLFKWLNSLHSVGISLVTNTPPRPGEVEKLCDRVGYLRTTNYGHEAVVRAKFDANNLAYTSNSLPLHTDLPYYDYVPGILLLHCIEQIQSEGGANQFVDGFHVAQELKDKDLEKFKLLCETRFQFVDLMTDVFGEFHLKFPRTVIELDENNQIIRFSFNNHVRDSVSLASPEKTRELYEAYVSIGKLLRNPANQIERKLTPGEMMTFNNSRVLHGRSAFTLTKETGSRVISSGFLDWDVVYSRMRVLARRFNSV